MKTKEELGALISKIAAADSPVGMDALYVHALILDKLGQIQGRIDSLESRIQDLADQTQME